MATTTTEPATSRLELVFRQWATMTQLQLDFVEKLGVYKLNVAQADLVYAVAASQWAVARMKASVARELQQSLARLKQQRGQTRRRQQMLLRRAHAIAKIRDGEQITSNQLARMWAAYTVFERAVPAQVIDQLIQTELDPAATHGRSYVNVRYPNKACPDPPASVDNVHRLIQWIRRNRYMPRHGTRAYRHVVMAFEQIGNVATAQNQELRDALQQLEQKTYDVWKPVVIAALPDSVDVKKITRIGTK